MTTDKHDRTSIILWILIHLSLFLLLVVPTFCKDNPIAYTDVNIMFTLLLSMAVSGKLFALFEEELKEVKEKLEKLNQRLDSLVAKTEEKP